MHVIRSLRMYQSIFKYAHIADQPTVTNRIKFEMRQDTDAEIIHNSNHPGTGPKLEQTTTLSDQFNTQVSKTIVGVRPLVCLGWCLFFIYVLLSITAGTLIVFFTADRSTNVTCQRIFIRTTEQAIGYDSRPQHTIVDHLNADHHLDLAVANVGSDTIDVFLGNGNGTFAPKIPHLLASGSRPYSMVQADFDHDQHIDLAVANYGTNSIAIHFGHANGTFSDAVPYPLSACRPASIAVGDVNRDNHSDLFVACYGVASVLILQGSHEGSFQLSKTYELGYDSTPVSLHVTDFNLDHVVDFALVDSSLSELVILLSQSSGEYVVYRYSTGAGSHPTSLTIGDFDGDHHSDVAVANQGTHSVVIFSGSTDGSFDRIADQYALGVTSKPKSITAVDLTNDTRLDLVVVDSNNDQALVLEGLGNGSFTLLTRHSTGYRSDSSFVSVGDFDDDDVADVVISNNNTDTILLLRSFSMYLNGSQTTYLTGPESYPEVAELVDVNGDGELDVIVGTGQHPTVEVLLGRGDGTFRDSYSSPVNSVQQKSVRIGDMNNDGKPDIVIGQYYIPTILIYHGTGNGSFVYGETIPLAPRLSASVLALADFNADGVVDIVFGGIYSEREDVHVLFRSNGDQPVETISYSIGRDMRSSSLLTVDLNKDGWMDFLLLLYSDNSIRIYLGGRNGSFNDPIRLSLDEHDPFAADVGDVNGDGRLDIVFIASFTSMVGIILARPDGTFSNVTLYSPGRHAFPYGVTLGYFNTDIHLDIAVANMDEGTIFLLMGRGDGTFGDSRVFPVGYRFGPSWIAMGDLNHDGQNDLIVTHSGKTAIGVFLIHLEGDFLNESTIRLESEPHPFSLLVADLDNNTQMDVVIANPGNDDVQVFLNHNNSTFSTMHMYQSATGSHPQCVTVADLNNDHHLDLLVANTWTGEIQVRLGEGNGTFALPLVYSTGVGSARYAIGVGDFTEDGWTDAAVVSREADAIQIFVGFDYLTFTQQQTPVIGAYKNPLGVAVADFNEDGIDDIAVVNFGSSAIDLFFGKGDGTFQEQTSLSTGKSTMPFEIRTADLNNDHHADLIVIGISAELPLGVLLGYGNGSFVLIISSETDMKNARSFELADVNNDSHLDVILMTYSYRYLVVYLGDGNGLFHTSIKCPISYNFAILDFTIGDLNHDGIVDLILPSFYGNMFGVLFGQGNGSFHNSTLYTTDDYYSLNSMTSGDLDNDNNTDLLFYAWNNKTIYVLFGSDDGGFASSMTLPIGSGSLTVAIFIRDLNNDGIFDIVYPDLGSGAGNLGVFYGRGNRSFAIRKNYLIQGATEPRNLQIADLNLDGKLDAVIIDGTKSILAILLQDKTEPFATPITLALSKGSHPTSIAVADVDHDRHLDMIILNAGTRTLDLLRGVGNGSFSILPILSTALGASPAALATGDLNGDGHVDLTVVVADTSQLLMYLGDGRGAFRWLSSVSTGVNSLPSSLAVDDVNDDGRVDVVVSNAGTNEVLIFYGQSNGNFSDPLSYALGYNARPQSVALGDVNGDGLVDVAVANYGNNFVEVLLQICVASGSTPR